MKWIARRQMGVSPAQVEVVWDRGNGFFTAVASTVCPHFPGDLPERDRNKIASIIKHAPEMLKLIEEISNSDEISVFRKKAQKILSSVNELEIL